MELSEHNWAIASFWQVGLLGVFLSEYRDESHNFTNLSFMTSRLSTLLQYSALFSLRKSRQDLVTLKCAVFSGIRFPFNYNLYSHIPANALGLKSNTCISFQWNHWTLE